jgi:XTP/dITP diphosphohydrolase
MRTAILASQNKNKIREIKAILEKYGLNVISRDDAGIPADDIEETGTTFEENSLLKASVIMDMIAADPALSDYAASPVIADDSGLMVDALGGRPGVYSARYAGLEKGSEANMDKLLSELQAAEQAGGEISRAARFRTVVALILDGELHLFNGVLDGEIARTRSGNEGFGYDPIFIPQGYEKTLAEITLDEKNAISHRGKAMRALADFLKCLPKAR